MYNFIFVLHDVAMRVHFVYNILKYSVLFESSSFWRDIQNAHIFYIQVIHRQGDGGGAGFVVGGSHHNVRDVKI